MPLIDLQHGYAQNCMYDLQTITPDLLMVGLSFLPNGGSNPVNNLVTGKGCASVTRIGGGAYTVVFDLPDLAKELVAAFWTVQSSTNVGVYAHGRAYTPNTGLGGTAGSIGVQVYTASTGATVDLAANANNRVDGWLLFQDAPSNFPG